MKVVHRTNIVILTFRPHFALIGSSFLKTMQTYLYFHSCVSQKEFNELRDEVQRLRQKVREIRKACTQSTIARNPLSPATVPDKLYDTFQILILKLFTVNYIFTHSVSGKPCHTSEQAIHPFDYHLYNVMINTVNAKHPASTSKCEILALK